MKRMQQKAVIEKENPTENKKSSVGDWLKRIGFAGFMFFLVKGLLWLVIIILPAYFAC